VYNEDFILIFFRRLIFGSEVAEFKQLVAK